MELFWGAYGDTMSVRRDCGDVAARSWKNCGKVLERFWGSYGDVTGSLWGRCRDVMERFWEGFGKVMELFRTSVEVMGLYGEVR